MFDKPDVDQSLVDLPRIQIAIIEAINAALPPQTPPIVRSSLIGYQEHLAKYLTQPIVGVLTAMFDAVVAEIGGKEADVWYGPGLKVQFDHWATNHDLLLEHFPLNAEREELFENIKIDHDQAHAPELTELLKELWGYVPKDEPNEMFTEESVKFLRGLEEQIANARSLPPTKDGKDQRIFKRILLHSGGVIGKMWQILKNNQFIFTIAANWKELVAVVKAIWEFICGLI